MINIVPILLLTFSFHALAVCNAQQASKPKSRAAALTTLKGCTTRPITLGCSEDTAAYLIELYQRGDKSLLNPLLEAGLTSDGALSEILGDFYSDVLWKNPREFLQGLKSRSKKDQQSLSWLAAATDGSGMSDDMLRDIQRNLRRIASQPGQLTSVASICLREVDRVNAKTK